MSPAAFSRRRLLSGQRLQHYHNRPHGALGRGALAFGPARRYRCRKRARVDALRLRAFAQAAFAAADLDLADHLESVEALKRPADLAYSAMDPSRIAAQLGWAANRSVQEIVAKMYRAEVY